MRDYVSLFLGRPLTVTYFRIISFITEIMFIKFREIPLENIPYFYIMEFNKCILAGFMSVWEHDRERKHWNYNKIVYY